MKSFIWIIVLFLIHNTGKSQFSFSKEYQFDAFSIGSSIVSNDDGSAIIASRFRTNNDLFRYVIFKINSQGDTVWVKPFDEGATFVQPKIIKVSNIGFLFVGSDKNESGVLAVRLSEMGEVIWSKILKCDINSFKRNPSVAEISGMGFVIASVGIDGLTCHKINYNGELEWTKLYKGGESQFGTIRDERTSLIVSSNNHLILVNKSYSDSIPNANAFIVKVDLNGNLVWSKTMGGNGSDSFRNVVETASGDYIAIGYTESFGQGGDDILLTKLDNETGNIIYSKTIGLENDQHVYSIKTGLDDNFYLVGISGVWESSTERNGLLIKIDSDGNILWSKSYMENCAFLDLDINNSNEISITGFCKSNPDEPFSTLAIKLDESNFCNFEEIELISQDQIFDTTDFILLESGGSVINHQVDSIKIEFGSNVICDLISNLNESPPELPEFEALKVYPNPSISEFRIDLQHYPREEYEFNIFDELGNLMTSEKVFGGGIYKIRNIYSLSGVYFYTLSLNNKILDSGSITFVN